MTTHILAVEDESAIRDLIRFGLERENYRVSAVEDVQAAVSLLAQDPADLALVDWMLPGSSGIEFIRRLRKDELTRDLPIIMLTARSEEHDITTGLDAGADDYLTKPFSPRELAARIRALLRRNADFGEVSVTQLGELKVDTSAMRVMYADTEINVSHTEFKLLQFMMKNANRVYSRAQLLDFVWGRDSFIEERTVDVHILRLRKLLKPYSADKWIETVRGAGYRFSRSADEASSEPDKQPGNHEN